MREIPMLFSTPMVKAILEGRKTQTRRIIKESFNGCLTNGGPHPCPNDPVFVRKGEVLANPVTDEPMCADRTQAHFHCSTLDSVAYPKVEVGDRIWVRETWCYAEDENGDCSSTTRGDSFGKYLYKSMGDKPHGKWKPSIHMPKAAARIWLEVTGVRVDRLQDISEEDAINEGIDFNEGIERAYRNYLSKSEYVFESAKDSFTTLWQSINGPESWNANPWVWVYTFKRIEP